MEITVIFVKQGIRYNSEEVNFLKDSVKLHCSHNLQFICHTDDPRGLDEDIKPHPITSERIGTWSKTEIFDIVKEGDRVLYLDIDTLVYGSIDKLVEIDPMIYLMMIDKSDWKPTEAVAGSDTSINSSVMLWKPSEPGPLFYHKSWKEVDFDEIQIRYTDEDQYYPRNRDFLEYFPAGIIWSRYRSLEYHTNNWKNMPIVIYNGVVSRFGSKKMMWIDITEKLTALQSPLAPRAINFCRSL